MGLPPCLSLPGLVWLPMSAARDTPASHTRHLVVGRECIGLDCAAMRYDGRSKDARREVFRLFHAGLDVTAGAELGNPRRPAARTPALPVKLDRSLVADIDADPIRRELIVGMGKFMQTAGCRLIAEGIETAAELATLRKLQVPLGQGYLLGRPAPAAPEDG